MNKRILHLVDGPPEVIAAVAEWEKQLQRDTWRHIAETRAAANAVNAVNAVNEVPQPTPEHGRDAHATPDTPPNAENLPIR